jgi:DoxX-like family
MHGDEPRVDRDTLGGRGNESETVLNLRNAMSGNRSAYWVATLLFTAFMAYNAFAYLTSDPRMMSAFALLGYPSYFPEILGVAKLLGIIALLMPAAPRIKEWAYAGFTFTLLGAILSHVAVGQPREAITPFVALAVMAVSYLLRPPHRRILEALAAVR